MIGKPLSNLLTCSLTNPMKVAVISDIHSNLPALRAVFSEIESHGIDRVLCAGDVVGYYPYPNEVIELLKQKDVRCVKGNHDEKVLGETDARFNRYAERAASWTARNLTTESKDYLANLDTKLDEDISGREVVVVHGSPTNETTEYIRERVVDDNFIYEFFDEPPEILILGNTHVPFVKESSGTLVVNPGSVGQPRDGDRRAAYAVLDLDDLEAEIYRVDYSIDEVASETVKELPAELAERLRKGK